MMTHDFEVESVTPLSDYTHPRDIARERVAGYCQRHFSSGSLIGETLEHQVFSPRVWTLPVIRPERKLAEMLYPRGRR